MGRVSYYQCESVKYFGISFDHFDVVYTYKIAIETSSLS